MTPRELVDCARRLVARPDPALAGVWERAAALLARKALEREVRQRLIRERRLQGHPSFRAQLLALRVLVGPELAARAAWTWAALSRATHLHGYALPPTAPELLRWIDAVEELLAARR